MVTANTTRLKQNWEECFLSYLPDYILLRSTHLVALAMFVFVRRDQVELIRNVSVELKKTGFGGMAGNKGGISVSLSIGDSRARFITAHFAAGQENVADRNQDYWTLRDAFQEESDMSFWFGDFNYRINLGNEDVRPRVAKQEYAVLLKHDQVCLFYFVIY